MPFCNLQNPPLSLSCEMTGDWLYVSILWHFICLSLSDMRYSQRNECQCSTSNPSNRTSSFHHCAYSSASATRHCSSCCKVTSRSFASRILNFDCRRQHSSHWSKHNLRDFTFSEVRFLVFHVQFCCF